MKLLKHYASDVHQQKISPIAELRGWLRRQPDACDIEYIEYDISNSRPEKTQAAKHNLRNIFRFVVCHLILLWTTQLKGYFQEHKY